MQELYEGKKELLEQDEAARAAFYQALQKQNIDLEKNLKDANVPELYDLGEIPTVVKKHLDMLSEHNKALQKILKAASGDLSNPFRVHKLFSLCQKLQTCSQAFINELQATELGEDKALITSLLKKISGLIEGQPLAPRPLSLVTPPASTATTNIGLTEAVHENESSLLEPTLSTKPLKPLMLPIQDWRTLWLHEFFRNLYGFTFEDFMKNNACQNMFEDFFKPHNRQDDIDSFAFLAHRSVGDVFHPLFLRKDGNLEHEKNLLRQQELQRRETPSKKQEERKRLLQALVGFKEKKTTAADLQINQYLREYSAWWPLLIQHLVTLAKGEVLNVNTQQLTHHKMPSFLHTFLMAIQAYQTKQLSPAQATIEQLLAVIDKTDEIFANASLSRLLHRLAHYVKDICYLLATDTTLKLAEKKPEKSFYEEAIQYLKAVGKSELHFFKALAKLNLGIVYHLLSKQEEATSCYSEANHTLELVMQEQSQINGKQSAEYAYLYELQNKIQPHQYLLELSEPIVQKNLDKIKNDLLNRIRSLRNNIYSSRIYGSIFPLSKERKDNLIEEYGLLLVCIHQYGIYQNEEYLYYARQQIKDAKCYLVGESLIAFIREQYKFNEKYDVIFSDKHIEPPHKKQKTEESLEDHPVKSKNLSALSSSNTASMEFTQVNQQSTVKEMIVTQQRRVGNEIEISDEVNPQHVVQIAKELFSHLPSTIFSTTKESDVGKLQLNNGEEIGTRFKFTSSNSSKPPPPLEKKDAFQNNKS